MIVVNKEPVFVYVNGEASAIFDEFLTIAYHVYVDLRKHEQSQSDVTKAFIAAIGKAIEEGERDLQEGKQI